MSNFSDNDKNEIIKKYLNNANPLGPVGAGDIKPDDLDVVSRELFATQNKIFENIKNRPSIVIGRKGAGKTSFLQYQQYNQGYKVAVWIDAPRTFQEIVNNINKIVAKKDQFTLVETVAKLWESLLWIEVSYEIQKRFPGAAEKFKEFQKVIQIFGLDLNLPDESVTLKILSTVIDALERAKRVAVSRG